MVKHAPEKGAKTFLYAVSYPSINYMFVVSYRLYRRSFLAQFFFDERD